MSVVAVLSLVSTVRSKDGVAVRFAKKLIAVQELRFLIEQKIATARAHILSGEPRYHLDVEVDRARLAAQIAELRRDDGESLRDHLARIEDSEARHQAAAERVVAETPFSVDDRVRRWQTDVAPFRDRLRNETAELVGETRRQHDAAEEEAQRQNRRAVVLIIVAALIGLIASAYLARSLTRRLAALYRGEQEALRKQRQAYEELQLIIDALPVMVAHIDSEGRYRFVNRAYEEWFGRRREDIVGKERLDLLGRDISSDFDSKVRRALAGERVVQEARVPHRDGTQRDVVATYVPRRGEGGKVIGFVSLVADVSAERRARERERILARATEVLSSSLEVEAGLNQMLDLLVPALADGGGAELAVPGQPREQVSAGAALPEIAGCGARVLEGGVAYGSRTALAAPMVARGVRFGALVLAVDGKSRIYDQADLGFVEELSRRAALAVDHARLYRAAQRALVEREELVAIVSHDLRNPLGVVLLKAEALAQAVAGTPAARHVESIERAAERMESLIQTLLDAARIESGRLELARRPLDPGAVAQQVAELLEGLATEKSVRLKIEVMPGVPLVFADPDRLMQVLENLLGNAVKFTPAGGHVEVLVAAGAGEARISVCDNGPGIAHADQGRLFDRWYQGERTRRKGLGLGLYIAHGIVEAHGGRIWVDSREGAGTTFTFTVPAADLALAGITDEAARSPDLH